MARPGLVLCSGSGLVPPPLCPSSSSPTCVSARGTILSCLHASICLSVCCLEATTWPLLRVSAGASETVVDLSASAATLVSLVLLPSESSISAPMQLYTMLTRSVDWVKIKMIKLNYPSFMHQWGAPNSSLRFRLILMTPTVCVWTEILKESLAHLCQAAGGLLSQINPD